MLLILFAVLSEKFPQGEQPSPNNAMLMIKRHIEIMPAALFAHTLNFFAQTLIFSIVTPIKFVVKPSIQTEQGYCPLPVSPGRSVVVAEQFVQLNAHQHNADEELQCLVFAHGNHLQVMP